jgi:UDP-N-acetylglucosamine 2-epimerase
VPVVFVTHPPTQRRLAASGNDTVLLRAGVRLMPLVEHGAFVSLLMNSEFVLTDGGSVQEEAAYTGTPCLVLRETTERDDGLGENAVLGGLDLSRARDFFRRFRDFRRPGRFDRFASPSAAIAEHILERFR